MSLNMLGHIDTVFQSLTITLKTEVPGSYDEFGDYVPGIETTSEHIANVQPATLKQIEFLAQGGERVTDVRQVWVNDGTSIPVGAELEFLGYSWKVLQADNRPWRGRTKVVVTRLES
ncbi:MAG: hypothetical protein R3268_05925 [Acidiferrobacterales bacterium]|nr:hypothetical protein [Acidiferrobacterales bacterium]